MHAVRGAFSRAARAYGRAARIASRLGARDLESLVKANLAVVAIYRWDLTKAESEIREAVRLSRGIGARRVESFARMCEAICKNRRGRLAEAIDILDEELRAARASRDQPLVVDLALQFVKPLVNNGEIGRAAKLTREASRKARELGLSRAKMRASVARGVVELHRGEPAKARVTLEDALASDGVVFRNIEAEALLFLGRAYIDLADVTRARKTLGDALSRFRSFSSPLRVAECRAQLARALALLGKNTEATRRLDEAWSFLAKLPRIDRPIVLWGEVAFVRSRVLRGSPGSSDRDLLELLHDLMEVRQAAASRGARFLRWKIAAEIARVEDALGHHESAEASRRDASELLDRLCEGLGKTIRRRLERSLESPDARPPGDDSVTTARQATAGDAAYRSLLKENERLRAAYDQMATRLERVESATARSDEPTAPLVDVTEFCGLVGSSEPMRRLHGLIEKVARSDIAVLVEGETGTGKSLILKAIHELSERASGPFVVESLSAIPITLVESELFGHERGAFSGATIARGGLIESAAGGTLCLEDVDELPLESQAKLLSVLESGEVRRLGADQSRRVDFRVLASTRTNLARAVEDGRFRRDLYHRLGVVVVPVPALRERLDDIPLLVRHFLERLGPSGYPAFSIDADAIDKLHAHRWQGNVRELENELRRLTLLGSGRIRGEDIHISPLTEPRDVLSRESIERVAWLDARDQLDRAYYQAAFETTGGDAEVMARVLGVHKRTIYKIRKRLGL